MKVKHSRTPGMKVPCLDQIAEKCHKVAVKTPLSKAALRLYASDT